MKKRRLEIAVISDVHLGTYGCHAEELLLYLTSIHPQKLILNGDIIAIWQFRKNYFPPAHVKVLHKLIDMASKGTQVYYITGNHDEMLRKFSGTSIGELHIMNNLVLDLDEHKSWFFHGDVFDPTIQHMKWLARLGGFGYDILILLNRTLNRILRILGKERYSLSKKIKDGVKNAITYITQFENTIVDIAIEKGYDHVVCGHIHQPKKQVHYTKKGSCTYLNSGDWVENLSALEYSFKRWKLYNYNQDKLVPFFVDPEVKEIDMLELLATIMSKKEATTTNTFEPQSTKKEDTTSIE